MGIHIKYLHASKTTKPKELIQDLLELFKKYGIQHIEVEAKLEGK